jgi:hypothetical protein
MFDRLKRYHWFVTSAANWAADDKLSDALKRLRKADKSAFPNAKPFPVAIYRVPGTNKDTTYPIRNYVPQVEGVEFCGYDDLAAPIGG